MMVNNLYITVDTYSQWVRMI